MSTEMHDTSYGRLALLKFNDSHPDFVVYEAEWLSDDTGQRAVLKVTGAVVRAAKSGPRKGERVVVMPNTKRHVYISRDELEAFTLNI